ncbi:hypothetical protein Tco_0201704 [Tanacetum coccineum]
MDNCHSIGTPLTTKPKLDVDLSGEPVDQSDYHSKIGSLMYLTSSRPDLVQAVCYCARYQARPTQKHLKEVKRIFKYLKGTINMGLWYPKDSGFELTAFSDADHAGNAEYSESTSGGIQFLGDKLVSGMSKKQNRTTMSLAEAKYVALSASYAQSANIAIIPIQTRYNISRNEAHPYSVSFHKGTSCENGIMNYILSELNFPITDTFTRKALPEDQFKISFRRIGMRSLTPAKLENGTLIKVEERNMICVENEELKMKVEVLSFNMRDVERMKRKLQAVKRDIGEVEIERNRCEEKCLGFLML